MRCFSRALLFFCWNREYTGYFICTGWTRGSHLCRGFGALFCHVCNHCLRWKVSDLLSPTQSECLVFSGLRQGVAVFFFPLKTKKGWCYLTLSRLPCELRIFSRIFHKKRPTDLWDVQKAKWDFPSFFRGSPSLARINLGPTFDKGP